MVGSPHSSTAALFHNQLEAYMGQLGTPYFQQWITDAIEKEKMKKAHLQVRNITQLYSLITAFIIILRVLNF